MIPLYILTERLSPSVQASGGRHLKRLQTRYKLGGDSNLFITNQILFVRKTKPISVGLIKNTA